MNNESDYPRIQVREVDPVLSRSHHFGYPPPNGVSFLPTGFFDALLTTDLMHEPTSAVLGPLLRRSGLAIEHSGPSVPFRTDVGSRWIGPILYFPAAVCAEAPELPVVVLRLISHYLTRLLGNTDEAVTAKLALVFETGAKTIRVEYEGPPHGIVTLEEQLKQL